MRFRDPTAGIILLTLLNIQIVLLADRIKIYVKMVTRIDLNITDDVENTNGECNAILEHEIGAIGSSNSVFDGYMADINFIDGQALDASYFGYTEVSDKGMET